MQGDTTNVSVAKTDNFGLGLYSLGHRRRGEFPATYHFLREYERVKRIY